MEHNNRFQYTYSAKEQEEIKNIRKKYEPPEQSEDKMVQLRRLDASVTQKATVVSLVLGIIGALVLGFGMSLIMTDLGDWFGFSQQTAMLIGIVIGVTGIVPICAAYPLYHRITEKERKKIAPDIIRLTDELMK